MGIEDIKKAAKSVDAAVEQYTARETAALAARLAASEAEGKARAAENEVANAREQVQKARDGLNAACDDFFRPAAAPAGAPGVNLGFDKAAPGPDHGRNRPRVG